MTQKNSPAVRAVLGPTNTGKTYLAVERMLGHGSGMIGFPLRLLAREIYDRVAKEIWGEIEASSSLANGSALAALKPGAGRAQRMEQPQRAAAAARAAALAAPAGAASSGNISLARRELQRDYINRVALLVLRPATRSDARSHMREQANRLAPKLELAAKASGLDDETRWHLQDSADTLRRALAAQLPRLGL